MTDQRVRVWSRRAAALVVAALIVLTGAAPASAATMPVPPKPGEVMPRATWENFMRQRVFGLRVPSRIINAGTRTQAELPGASQHAASVRRVAAVRSNAAAGARGLTLVPSDAVTSASAGPRKVIGATARGLGNATAAYFALDLTYSATSGLMEFAGITAMDETSGDLLCDVSGVLGLNQCQIGPAPGYVPNSDMPTDGVPGWVGGLASVPLRATTPTGPVDSLTTFDLQGAQLAPVNSSVTVGGTLGAPSYYPRLSVTLVGVFARPDGSLVEFSVSAPSGGWNTGTPQPVKSVMPDLQATWGPGTRLLYIEPLVNYMGSQGWPAATSNRELRWYPEGSPDRPEVGAPDPVREWVTTFECSDGSTGTASSLPFRESDPEWSAPADPSCPNGGQVEYVRVDQVVDGAVASTLYEWALPAAAQEFADQYPQCGDGQCVLELHRLDAATGTEVACFDNPDACYQWFEDPARDQTYACTYGGEPTDLAECYVYAPTFRWEKSTTAGPAYGDPVDGSVPPSGGGTTPPPPSDASGCGSKPPFEFTLGGIGYWVSTGVEWAGCKLFVPSDAKVRQVADEMDDSVFHWVGATFGQGYSILNNMPTDGCGVIAASDIAAFGGREVRISTCDEPWTSFAPVREVLGWGFIVAAAVVGLITCLNTIRVRPVAASSGGD